MGVVPQTTQEATKEEPRISVEFTDSDSEPELEKSVQREGSEKMMPSGVFAFLESSAKV